MFLFSVITCTFPVLLHHKHHQWCLSWLTVSWHNKNMTWIINLALSIHKFFSIILIHFTVYGQISLSSIWWSFKLCCLVIHKTMIVKQHKTKKWALFFPHKIQCKFVHLFHFGKRYRRILYHLVISFLVEHSFKFKENAFDWL